MANSRNNGRIIADQLHNPNELDVDLQMELGPFETNHKWTKLLECDVFVGAKRSKHTAVSYKDAIYMFGGDNGKNMLNDLIRFDTKEESWTKIGGIGTPPAPRYHHSAVVHRSSMFVFGGYTGNILANSDLTNKNDLYEYKFPSAQWLQWKFVGPEPVPRSAHGAAVYDDKLWIFAGYDGNARLNDMWTVNLTGEVHQWEKIEQRGECPPTCCNFPVAVARGKMYVFSGQSGAQITNALFEFDFETFTWSRVCTEHVVRCTLGRGGGEPPARRYGHVMLAHARHLYVFGGAADSTLPPDVYCFDLDTQAWSVLDPAQDSQIPPGRLFHAGAILGDALYIFGGTLFNNVRSGDLYRLKLSNYPRCTLHDDFGRLLSLGQFSDLTILVGPEETPMTAHQCLLAARSHYLRNKIRSAREEYTGCVNSDLTGPVMNRHKENPDLLIRLPDAPVNAFRMVLSYIYTDRIDPTDKHENPTTVHTMLIVMDVLSLASLYVIPRLRCLCARYLKANLSYANVIDTLHAAHNSGLTCVKEYCMRFIVKEYNYREIVMSSQFETLERALMVEVIRRHQSQQSSKPPRDTTLDIVGTSLEQDMEIFVRGGGAELCDVTLRIVGNIERVAHRAILAARADYFEAMFRSFSPKDNIVNIRICDTVPPESAFDALLQYIYYGETNMATKDALYLYQAPIYYGFTNNRLQVFCKHNLQSNVSVENVLAILQAADAMPAPDVKDYALKLIIRNLSQVGRQEAIKTLPQPLLVDIMYALSFEMNIDTPASAPRSRALTTSCSVDTLSDNTDNFRYGPGKS